MPVRSRRVINAVTVTTVSAALYTVPANRTLVVRAVWISRSSPGLPTTWRIFLPGAAGYVVMRQGSITTGSFVLLEDWWVLNPGDEFRMDSTQAVVEAILFGALLNGPPT